MPLHLQLPFAHHALPRPSLRLGLVNNLQPAAFISAEQQFLSLLEKASAGISVSVSLFALPGMLPPGHERRYQSLASLMENELDGLIVTGREPLTHDLRAEPYWESFRALLDWASRHTSSTLCSCLAAHAAVLSLDGIVRQRRAEKCSGILHCRQTATHPLTRKMPVELHVPHSRWNRLDAEKLRARGYKVLTSTHEGEADLFIKEAGSLFLFAQGHPEYEADTLLREFRRDLGRYARNELDLFPAVPCSYFDPTTEAALKSIQVHAQPGRRTTSLAESLAVLDRATIENTWSATAECLYRNWLALLAARSRARLHQPLLTNIDGPSPLLAL